MNLPKQTDCPLFHLFWAAYPQGYKGSKMAAQKAWIKLAPDAADLGLILTALERQKKERGWADGFGIPHASTYLNQARFMDEPILDAPKVDTGWRRSDDGILAKGRELGLQAKIGETMREYLGRIDKVMG